MRLFRLRGFWFYFGGFFFLYGYSVALTPLIAVQIMGISYKFKLAKQLKASPVEEMLPADSDTIVEFTEE